MKTAGLLFASLLLFFVFSLSNCSPDHNFSSSTQETLTRNNWSVDYYFETQDLTNEYGGYDLLFSGTGTISAQKGNEVVSGNWSTSSDANNNEVITISLNTSDVNLNKLSQGWKLVNQTTSTMQFEDNTHLSNPNQLWIKKQ